MLAINVLLEHKLYRISYNGVCFQVLVGLATWPKHTAVPIETPLHIHTLIHSQIYDSNGTTEFVLSMEADYIVHDLIV